MLSDLQVNSKINAVLTFTGTDTADTCPDPTWFQTYPHHIQYQYNSRGFRDAEWPADLKNAIWCIGDSATAGIGSPIEHTWPRLLSQATNTPTINISMDGASNDCLSRLSAQVLTEIQPVAIVHQWSFIHRRETASGDNEQRRVHYSRATDQEDIANLIAAITRTERLATTTKLVHSFVPEFAGNSETAVVALKALNLPNIVYFFDKLDFGRDLLHYGPKTSETYVRHYLKLL